MTSLANMADDVESGKRETVRDFCCSHVKSIATSIMMFAMVLTVVMIVMGESNSYSFFSTINNRAHVRNFA